MANGSLRLVYICGSGHSGSTLLTFLLNGHSSMVGLSEVIHINTRWMTETETHRAFWSQVASQYESDNGRSFAELRIKTPSGAKVLWWTDTQVDEWVERNCAMLQAVSHLAGKPILVDATKNWQRLYLLERSRRFDLHVIHLVRDGRAVVNSYLRKRIAFGRALRAWLTPSVAAIPLRRLVARDRWLRIRYEDLTADTEATLRRICDFVGVPFENQMLDFRRHPYVGIGGNGMRRRQGEQRITSDTRWHHELTTSSLIRFAALGGLLNRYYGYDFRRNS
jgi:hypothetical protein